MAPNDLKNSIEAILFAVSGPIEAKKLEKNLKINSQELETAINELNHDYQQRNAGLVILFDGLKAEMTTNSKFSSKVKAFIQEDLQEELTPASIETLAVIAYRGPLSKSQIDNLRGVNSAYILRQLLIRGLVERVPNPERLNSFIYKPSFDFLKHLGIPKPENLPEYESYHTKAIVTEPENQNNEQL